MTASNSPINLYQQLTSARVVSTSNLSGLYSNGPTNNGVAATLLSSANGALIIDSVNINIGDRILLAGQTSSQQNGLYDVLRGGSSNSLWLLQRSNDFQCIEQMKAGQFLTINEGTTNLGKLYVLTAPLPSAIGVNAITFTVQSGGGGGGDVTYTSPSIVDHIAAFTTTNGNISQDVTTAINFGNFQAGDDSSGIAGYYDSYSNVANSGRLRFQATQNSGDFTVVVNNTSMGQSTTFIIPDPAIATADFLVVPDGALTSGNLISAKSTVGLTEDSGVAANNVQLISSIFAEVSGNIANGLGPSLTVPVTGMNSFSVVVANIVSATTPGVFLTATTVGTGSFTVTPNIDPGASLIISFIAFPTAQ